MMRSLRMRAGQPDDQGFTLIEFTLAGALFTALLGLLTSAVFTTATAVARNQSASDLNQEARVSLIRMTSELRQAKLISAVTNPPGSVGYIAGGDTLITFQVDINGDGVINDTAAGPETLTYSFGASPRRVTVSAAGEVAPVLAAGVRSLSFDYRGAGKPWTDFDASPATGNNNGKLDVELRYIDTIQITLVMSNAKNVQRYTTTVNLRNNTR